MKHITHTSIEKAIGIIDNLDDDGLEQIAEKYALEQPVLMGYAMSAAAEYENEEIEGLLIYYFCLIIEAFKQEGATLNKVEEDAIDAFEEPFFEMLDAYFENDDDEIIEDFCDQPHLTGFMVMEISEPDEDGTELDDDTASQLFIVALAMITLLSRSIQA